MSKILGVKIVKKFRALDIHGFTRHQKRSNVNMKSREMRKINEIEEK
jgi:hypothetical protein